MVCVYFCAGVLTWYGSCCFALDVLLLSSCAYCCVLVCYGCDIVMYCYVCCGVLLVIVVLLICVVLFIGLLYFAIIVVLLCIVVFIGLCCYRRVIGMYCCVDWCVSLDIAVLLLCRDQLLMLLLRYRCAIVMSCYV